VEGKPGHQERRRQKQYQVQRQRRRPNGKNKGKSAGKMLALRNKGNSRVKGARPKASANGADTGGRYEGNRKRGNLEIDGVPWNGKTEATAVFVAWVVRVRTECLRRILRQSAGESPTPRRQR